MKGSAGGKGKDRYKEGIDEEEIEKYLGVVLRGREWEIKAGKWSEEGLPIL